MTMILDEPISEEAFGTEDLVLLNAYITDEVVVSEVLGP